ncbi:MAG: phospho-N-acetylmuramoyl-pentapeptide-transferase [Alphaproteobacteria bacterium]
MVGGITFRCALAALTAFAVAIVFGGWLIRKFRKGRVIEDTSQPDHDGLNAIQSLKKDVPTMGGLMALAGIVVALLLWSDLRSGYVQAGLLCLMSLGVLGLVDDYIKLRVDKSRGLRKRTKLAFQFALGAAIGLLILMQTGDSGYATRIYIPFTNGLSFNIGRWYILWSALLIAASSNAVNLADGLDGLAGGCVAMAAAALLGLGCFVIHPAMSSYLSLPNVAGGAELCVMSAAIVGAMLGFLWYNCHPAQIFMGDTGSLSLGGLLGFIALALKLDLLLFLAGAVFFLDMITVLMQIVSFKLTRKRVFPITPIHHCFQTKLHWPEQKITVRLWIIGALAIVISLAALRLG